MALNSGVLGRVEHSCRPDPSNGVVKWTFVKHLTPGERENDRNRFS
jgi:hypothetical protein